MLFAPLLLLSVALAGVKSVPMDRVDAGQARELFEGRRLALLVGPESFTDDRFPDLRFPADDALGLAEILEDPQLGRFDLVITLSSPEEAGLNEVRQAMEQISQASTSPDDTVFVYFSTHGTLERDASGDWEQYLVLPDTRLDRIRSTAMAHTELLDWLDTLESQRKLLLLATCHSGKGKSAFSEQVRAELTGLKGPPVPPLLSVSESTMVVGVCGWNETARESQELGHDIYTAFFLDALQNGDLDQDGAVSATEAHDVARQATWAWTGGQQRPYARVEVTGTDPILLSGKRKRAGLAELVAYGEQWDGWRVSVDGAEKGVFPGQITLEPGRHEIALLEPGSDQPRVQRSVVFLEGLRLGAQDLLRQDRVRLGVGAGWMQFGQGAVSGPMLSGEIQIPRLLGWRWELVGKGAAVGTWPYPSLSGGLSVERILTTGALQARAGLGFQAFMLQGEGLLAPSLVPEPSLGLCYLPNFRRSSARFMPQGFARLSIAGGWLWYTDQGKLHNTWQIRPGFLAGVAF